MTLHRARSGFNVVVAHLDPLPRPTSRVDERDTMFARDQRRPGTEAYRDTYGRHPEWRAHDDRIRAMPELMEPGGKHYDAGPMAEARRAFDAIEEIVVDPAEVEALAGDLAGAGDATAAIKKMVLDLGAVAVGVTALDEAFVYTHKGRFDDEYGREVVLDHPTALVFLVEMDHARMQCAPRAPTLLESARQYHRAARIAKVVAAVLSASGHDAKAHFDAHYDVMLPPLAVNAGLGEIGRNNILVADRFGSRVRIGAVTTAMDLVHDRPRSLGVARFCEVCGKCAENCPSNALTVGPREEVRGVSKWPTDERHCYAYWRQVGTDCGVCMACCPFSHENSTFHRLVRWTVRTFPMVSRVARWFDDVVYGRRWDPK